jgi:glucan phosphoethanolaminetransferase (alkaline phosphatase superfamily)
MAFSPTTFIMAGFTRSAKTALSLWNIFSTHSVVIAVLVLFQRHSSRRNDVYNILWAVVFGFATLNILSLAARRFEPNRRGLTFGELMAVLIVLLSIFLLGWELLGAFHIFPIKLHR